MKEEDPATLDHRYRKLKFQNTMITIPSEDDWVNATHIRRAAGQPRPRLKLSKFQRWRPSRPSDAAKYLIAVICDPSLRDFQPFFCMPPQSLSLVGGAGRWRRRTYAPRPSRRRRPGPGPGPGRKGRTARTGSQGSESTNPVGALSGVRCALLFYLLYMRATSVFPNMYVYIMSS